ncbi:hypothetical protein ABMA27_014326 [Loxostege sticticalis]|uniref:Endonuclease/exonuclease/phosphatase domain-containing protein n=1 Tax=Loxostege sticticalis TaxID=481309 RepID=A0ABR3I8J0_LOXSC
MAQKFVVANINHCARSQDLLHQSLAQWSIEICVVTEPYLIPERENWAGDKEGTVAVVTNTSANSPPFKSVRKGHGCVATRIGEIEVIGVYFSPNRLFSEFEVYMAQLGVFLSGCNRRDNIIVAGDLNAKSVAWGSPATDVQGELVEDWVVANGLTIMNRGTVHTCVRRRGGSIVRPHASQPTPSGPYCSPGRAWSQVGSETPRSGDTCFGVPGRKLVT